MPSLTSNLQPLGTIASPFSLPNHNPQACTEIVTVESCKGRGLLIAFICNHCPYVLHIVDRFADIGNALQQQGIDVIAINVNDSDRYPQDAPQNMPAFAARHNFQFPYCYDESQQSAKDYGAVCTPDFFLFDDQHKLVYCGEFDGSRPANSSTVTGDTLSAAAQAMLRGDPIANIQKPSMGCSIKWKT